jgi:cysteine-rich repeat protein
MSRSIFGADAMTSIRTNTLRRAVALAMVASLAAAPVTAGVPADSADDVCAPADNPCNVTQVIDVQPDAILDFGTRSVNVTLGGQFNFDINSGQILSGPFSASTTNPAIKANGQAPVIGGTLGGTVTIKARRLCTGGPGKCSNNALVACTTNGDCGLGTCTPKVKPACVDENDCMVGTCGVRRCSLRPSKTCTEDTNCQLGTCGLNKRCTGSATFVRCSTNADCDYGSCPQQLTCSNRALDPVACAVNTDCDFGACSTGTASITLNGAIAAASDNPATVILRAADSVSISKLVNLNSTSIDADGGDLTVDAAFGSIALTGKINATGGGDSQGGTVEMTAGLDATLSEEINLNGGDFDGGSFEVSAARDIVINRSIFANSSSGAGFGGEIVVDAGRDLQINGVSASNKTTLETSGHTDIEFFAGDGGTQDVATGRNMSINANTRLIGLGSQPDGYGSDMFFDATQNLTLAGDITAKSLGLKGAGGFVELLVGGTTQVTSLGTMDATGGDGGGGVIEFDTTGNVDFAGFLDVSGSQGGPGGSAFVDSSGTSTVSGTLFVNGDNGGDLEVDGCRVTLTGTGKMDNNVPTGDNRIVVGESMRLLAGSEMTSGPAGKNTLVYRSAAKPPVIQGLVSPAPTLVVNPGLTGCPVCGNLEIDQGETCDDGNLNNGDGCSSACQNEKCLQQTVSPGFPTVALCEDGNVCTADVCNTTLNGGTCQHPAKDCSDGFACTADSCNPADGVCVHVPNNSLCNDNNDCSDDACTVQSGCTFTANSNGCNDQENCTENDTCSNKMCTGTPVQGCSVCGNGDAEPPELCDDGNTTFANGEYCGLNCAVLIPCGKPTNSSGTLPKSSDALYVLRAAVAGLPCHVRVCDADGTGLVKASDALRILRSAVGQPVDLNCPTS